MNPTTPSDKLEQQVSPINDLSNKMTGVINDAIQKGCPPPQVISLMEYIKHDLIAKDLAIQKMVHLKANTVAKEALDAQPKG